jgi:3-deoxy-D-manno-octulosonic-acid transferase
VGERRISVTLCERCALSVYGWVMWALQPLLRFKLSRRARLEPGYAYGVDQRFGHRLPARPMMPVDQPLVWLHAVSLGETRAAAVLLRALRHKLPGMRLLLTHSTATGLAEGAGLLQEGDVQSWFPWDTPGAVNRFLSHFRPQVGVLMETEVWPQLMHACRRLGIPMVLANARMNKTSFERALRWSALSRPAYAGLTQVCAQTKADAQRLRQLGASAHDAWGNLKFDADPSPAHLTLAKRWRQASVGGWPFTIMLASSREGEELLFLKEIQALTPDGIDPSASNIEPTNVRATQWLIVPRHPHRFDEVAQLVQAEGFQCSRRSTWGETGPPPSQSAAGRPVVWLGDSLGDMALYYGMADVALLGGSFAPMGGQNLIEGAACGCPLVLGPHTHNFSDAAEEALTAGAALRAANMQEGLGTAVAWLGSPRERQRASDAGVAFARAHKGAADRMAAAVTGWVSAPPAR